MSNVLDNEGFTAKKYLLRPETMRPKLLRPILTIFLRHCIFLIPIFLRQRPRLVFKSKIFDTETLKIIGKVSRLRSLEIGCHTLLSAVNVIGFPNFRNAYSGMRIV